MNKTKGLIQVILIWCIFQTASSQAQSAKELLLKSKAACEQVKSASFNSEVFFKFFDAKDTLHIQGRLNLMKVDTNLSGVIGRMVKVMRGQTTSFYQFANYRSFTEGVNNIQIDTVYYKNGFKGNIHDELFNIGFMKTEPFKFLSEEGHEYKIVDSNTNTFRILVHFKPDEEADSTFSLFEIDKASMIPISLTGRTRLISQNQFQYRKILISQISVNDDSANYFLRKFNEQDYDSIKYSIRYVMPQLLNVGEKAPQWTAAIYGKKDSLSLSQLRGKYVLMDFWYSSCYPCLKAIPSLNRLQEKFKNKLVVVGMNPFDPDVRLKTSIPQNKIKYVVAKCDASLANSTFHVSAYPTMYLLNKHGEIIKTHLGFSENEKDVIEFESEISELIK